MKEENKLKFGIASITIIIAGLALGFIFFMSGCFTSNTVARKYGGKETVYVNANRKLVNMTWKDSDLWFLERDRKPGEKPETYYFEEISEFGVYEGTVTVIEKAEGEK